MVRINGGVGRRILATGLGSFWGGRVAQALENDPAFEWKAMRPRRLKGIGWTPLWVLRRPGEGSSAALPIEVVRRMQARRARRRAKAEEGVEE